MLRDNCREDIVVEVGDMTMAITTNSMFSS
jgi:hypothetical protein